MNRKEAERRINTRVSAWTAYRGTYAGELVEILPLHPWRGLVKVEFVLGLPEAAFAHVMRQGEIVEVGGINIKPHTGSVVSWPDSVNDLLVEEEAFLAKWKRQLDSGTKLVFGERTAMDRRVTAVEKMRHEIFAPVTP